MEKITTDFLLYNAQLLTIAATPQGTGCNELLGLKSKGAIAAKDGKIVWVGESAQIKSSLSLQKSAIEIDAKEQVVSPALIEPHSHLSGHPYGRADDFQKRVYGADSYEGIAKKGGGILTTVLNTKSSSKEQLLTYAKRIATEFLRHGTGTIEAKSGYGLELDEELKQLQVLQTLEQTHPMGIISTYLVHTLPASYKDSRTEYIDYALHKILPQAKELAKGIDIFCDPIAFNVEESARVIEKGIEQGLFATIHVDQTAPFGASEVLAKKGATSLSHLEYISNEGIKQMAENKTIAIVFPTCSLNLDAPFAPVNKLIEAGVEVALSTDWNPGSSPCSNLLLVAYLAARKMKMPLAHIMRGLTIIAAKAIGQESQIGSLEIGKSCDLAMYQLEDWRDLITQCGNTPEVTVVKQGKVVWEKGRFCD